MQAKTYVNATRWRARLKAFCKVRTCNLLIFCASLLAEASGAQGGIWHVNVTAAPGGDGTSWSMAYQAIQPAIDSAFADGGGEVWVAQGTYGEERQAGTGALVLKQGVSLYGGFEGTESAFDERNVALHRTVISGSTALAGGAAQNTVVCESHSRLDGFEVSGATGSGILAVSVESVVIATCHMANNAGGGAIASDVQALHISDCLIDFNGDGGIIIGSSLASVIERCEIANNRTDTWGGGGFFQLMRQSVIRNCVFRDNIAEYGGGMFLMRDSSYDRCLPFTDYPLISNCTICNNQASGLGGGIFAYDPPIKKGLAKDLPPRTPFDCSQRCWNGDYFPWRLVGSVVYGNIASRYGGIGWESEEMELEGANNIVWGNSKPAMPEPNAYSDASGSLDLKYYFFLYSDVEDCQPGEGNFCADPLFVDPARGDFHLQPDSPCIDAGLSLNHPCLGSVTIDAGGTRRGLDYPTVPDVGDGSAFDIGTYELNPQTLAADRDGDHILSLAELLRVIQFYNSGSFHCQPGTEDRYAPGGGATDCVPHTSDFDPQDWSISLPEILRAVQFYNSLGYHYCPTDGTEDGFCPGA